MGNEGLKQRVLFLYNWVPDHERTSRFHECAKMDTVKRITQALTDFEMDVVPVNLFNPAQLEEVIQSNAPLDVAFVIAEGFLDHPESLYDGSGPLEIWAILESHRIAYTHSGVETMEACRNKDLTYEALSRSGIAIPRFYAFSGREERQDILRAEQAVGYPMFVKPAGGGGSIGVDPQSVVYHREQFLNKVSQLRKLIGDQPIIAETYLSGREYTAGVIGNGIPYVFPIIAFPEYFSVRSQKVKSVEYQNRNEFELLEMSDPKGIKIREAAVQVFQALGARDLIRIDLKEDDHGNVYVIDVNGTPSLATKGSLAYMAERLTISHSELVGFLLYVTMTREGLWIPPILQETGKKVISMLQNGIDGDRVA